MSIFTLKMFTQKKITGKIKIKIAIKMINGTKKGKTLQSDRKDSNIIFLYVQLFILLSAKIFQFIMS